MSTHVIQPFVLEPWQDRVIAEKAHLDEKIVKLLKFLAQPEVPIQDYLLLDRQCQIMQDYSRILEERISNFN